MAVEDRPCNCRAQESGVLEVLSGRPCWASHSVLSTHSSSALARLFPQSPPKLNEANSDASRETAHAQSGSESSSQEAAPKKGTAQPCTHPGADSRSPGRDSCGPDGREEVGLKCLCRVVGGHALLTRTGLPTSSGRKPGPADLCFFLGSPCCAESLAESAAAYTKATAWTCLLEKVEVITGEEAESNVLQVRPSTQDAEAEGLPGIKASLGYIAGACLQQQQIEAGYDSAGLQSPALWRQRQVEL